MRMYVNRRGFSYELYNSSLMRKSPFLFYDLFVFCIRIGLNLAGLRRGVIYNSATAMSTSQGVSASVWSEILKISWPETKSKWPTKGKKLLEYDALKTQYDASYVKQNWLYRLHLSLQGSKSQSGRLVFFHKGCLQIRPNY